MLDSKKTSHIDFAGTAAILMATLCWASGPVFIHFLAGHLDAWSQNLWRYTVAALFWLPFLAFKARNGAVSPHIWKLAVIPAVPNIAMQCLWGWTFYFIEPGFGSLLARSALIWTALFSLIYFRDERPLVKSKRFWSAMLLSIAGLIMVIVTREGFTARASLTGIILMLSAGVVWSVYTISIRIVFKNVDSRIGFSIVSLYTAAGLAVIAVLFGKPAEIFSLPPLPWACVIISGILSIALAHTFYYVSMRRIGATIPALVLQVTPFATILISIAVFAEQLRLWQWLGGIILVAGTWLAILAQQYLKKP